MLKPLIKNPHNKREREEAPRRQAAVDRALLELANTGAAIHQLKQTLDWLLDVQTDIAEELRAAGANIEGTIEKRAPGADVFVEKADVFLEIDRARWERSEGDR